MNVILFDPQAREQLLPIVYTRPVCEIRVGAFTIKEKWEQLLGIECSSFTVPYLSEKYPVSIQSENLYIDGSVLPNTELVKAILSLNKGMALYYQGQIIAFKGKECSLEELYPMATELKKLKFVGEVDCLRKCWDVVSLLNSQLLSDLKSLFQKAEEKPLPAWVTSIQPEDIRIGDKVILGACILNASHGPIFIDDEAEIMDGAILRGPIYIGKHSVVKMGAKIYGPVSAGQHCRVGGEVCDSVFQAYSNKGHDGFLGHSYLGEWCNLGADTNISNLKNTYEPVRMWNYATQRFEHSGLQFLGLVMGDHSKTGINTMINSGTVIGVACNVYGAGFPRNFVPSFSTGSNQRMEVFSVLNVVKMATAMMQRRGIECCSADEKMFQYIFNTSSKYRRY